MKLISWNVNGLRAMLKKGFFEWWKSANPDILCLQEIKAQTDQLPENILNPEGYHAFFNPAEKKGYSGVATFSKSAPVKTTKGFGDPKFDAEGRVLQTDFDTFTLFNIYFPNGQRDPERLSFKLDFYNSMLGHFENLRKQGRKLVICGDVNTAHKAIDLARPKENEKNSGFLEIERRWIDKLIDHGYVDTFRHFCKDADRYSYWDNFRHSRERNVGWRIDYFFVTEDLLDNLKDAWISDDVMGSDHCPVGIELAF
ncbi:MAG: exodeoxyribonuclease III [Bacteroidetes bacterium]|nr:exodeoxyribonuclease III [Bacteroidota bacterium]